MKEWAQSYTTWGFNDIRAGITSIECYQVQWFGFYSPTSVIMIKTISSHYEIFTNEAIQRCVNFQTSATLFPKLMTIQGINLTKFLIKPSSRITSPSISINKELTKHRISGQGSFKHSFKTIQKRYRSVSSLSSPYSWVESRKLNPCWM